MRVNATGFTNELNTLMGKIEKNVATVWAKTLVEVYFRVVRYTPVKSGYARSCWVISLAHDDTIPDNPYDGGEIIENGKIIQEVSDNFIDEWGKFYKTGKKGFNFKLKDGKVYLYNNCVYIEVLEQGSSTQAPNGMVGQTIQEFEEILKERSAQMDGLRYA